MIHSTEMPSEVDTFLEYYLPNDDGSPPGVNDLEIQYGRKNMDRHPQKVMDMRKGDFTLEKNGFQLVPHHTKVTDFSDKAAVKANYYPEIVESIKKATGAKEVICIGHTVRTGSQVPDVDNARNFVDCHGPSRRVHVDVTPVTCSAAVELRLGKEFMEKNLSGKWKLMNAWRPIKPVYRDPLGVADAASVPEEDLVTVYRVFPDGRTEERFMLKTGKKEHDWYYAPGQTPEELLLFTQYSSKDRTVADRVPHAAFNVPGTENNLPRESLEVRAIVCY